MIEFCINKKAADYTDERFILAFLASWVKLNQKGKRLIK